MAYLEISITTSAELAEKISELLFACDALSVTFEDAANESLFQIELDETPLWQNTKVIALFPADINVEKITAKLENNLELSEPLQFEITDIKEQDWVRITQQSFKPQCFGKDLWICPSWFDTRELSGNIVKIDPGLAFGTGTHPTTSLCLQWLAENPPKDKTVIDYGCGSGILAIAALAFNATEVFAVDHDPQALEATFNNTELNDFAKNKLHILLPEQLPNITVDVVIANILANPLIELAPKLISLLNDKGQLILSGILNTEIDAVSSAYNQKLQQIDCSQEKEWARIVFE